MNNDDFQLNLVNLLKLFKSRPYHLAKYLLDNNALTKDFVNKVYNSDKLNKVDDIPFFSDISEMTDFYESLLEGSDEKRTRKTEEEIIRETNDRMDFLISNDKFEEASMLRDYMIKNKIKRLK